MQHLVGKITTKPTNPAADEEKVIYTAPKTAINKDNLDN